MTAPATLAAAQAQCRAMGVDLRAPLPANGPRLLASGAPMPVSECMDLLLPFCPGGGVRSVDGVELPQCVSESVSPAKAAALLKEAEARAAAASSSATWLLGLGALVGVGALVYWYTR